MNISFDFDGTIDIPQIKKLAEAFKEHGHTIWIITSRPPGPMNKDVMKMAEELGIETHVKYTNYEYKYEHLEGFDIHFDNDPIEVNFINNAPGKTVAFLYPGITLEKNLV